MATVTATERRILRDYFGYTDPMVDNLREDQAVKLLSDYHSRTESGFYNTTGAYTGPTPDEAAGGYDWIGEGLFQTSLDIGEGVQGAGEALIVAAKQLGTGLADTVGVTSKILKWIVPAAAILAGYLVYLRFRK